MRNLILIGLVTIFVSFDIPKGWIIAGSKPKSYDMGIEAGAGIDGKNAATIKSKQKVILGFGTLMQNASPFNYINKKIRMTGYLKTKDVKGWSGFWLRVDEAGKSEPLAFDNMSERSLDGTRDWAKHEIVLEVPNGATNLAYGCILAGTGQVWFDSITFSVADKSIPTTGIENVKRDPVNLNFED